MKQSILIAIMLITALAISAQTTYLVGNPQDHPDIPFHYETIPVAILASADGDTIIVYPGRYQGPQVNFSGKNIYITSRYKYTNDRNDIYNTIIDRQNSLGSAVVFTNNETRNAVLNGFTIENGIGEFVSNPQFREGGGIYIRNASPTILNCVIQNNTASGQGGGVSVQANGLFVSPLFAGNIIKSNSTSGQGGGIRVGSSATNFIQVIFDSNNKNSIFQNNAPESRDISSVSHLYMSVMLDTFTVATQDPYYINMLADYYFSCEHYIIEQIDQDMYVSVSGNDTNTGLTLDSPLKTIKEAMIRIKSNHDNRNTIYIAPGYYRASEGQIFPILIKSDVILQGSGQEATIIDLEQNAGAINSDAGAKNYKISGIAFINNWAAAWMINRMSPIILNGTDNCEISDCLFENNLGGIQTQTTGGASRSEPMLLKNLSFSYNYNNVIELYLDIGVFENIKILNNRFESFGGSPVISGTPVIISANIGISNTRGFYSLSNILIANTSDVGAVGDGQHDMSQLFGTLAIKIGDNTDLLLNNATIVNNNLIDIVKDPVFYYTIFMYIGQNSNVRAYNSIFWHNSEFYIRGFETSTFYIDHSLLEGGPSSVLCNLVWGEGNIDEYPNFDYEYEGYNDWPYQLMASSPCVDAGSLAIARYDWLAGDLLRNPRVVGETVDMGAYEFNGSSDFFVDFVGSPQTGEVPLTVQFTDLSVGYDIYAWQWDLDNDGVFDSFEQNPIWVYNNTGQTTVRLVVNNGQGSCVKPEYINPRPVGVINGSLQGLVTSDGVPLSDVIVMIMGTGVSAFTNEWGIYSFAEVMAGEYAITAMKDGYQDYFSTGLVVVAGEVTTHNIVMSTVSDSDEVAVALATGLVGNYPNPFNPSTVVVFSLAKQGFVEIDVFNIKGERVKRLVNGLYGVGKHRVVWDGADDMGRGVGSGVYFYRLRAGGVVDVRKMLLVK